jgi:cysteine desulfurase/selenocysteine lyase
MSNQNQAGGQTKNFEYADPEACYFDSACQTLRPMAVVDALNEYFLEYNACGGRVKYEWGQKVDAQVSACRKDVIELLSQSEKDYFCAFTLNTTYGINLILSQLRPEHFSRIVVSDIEHNSVFVPTMAYAERNGWKRQVLPRDDNGNLKYTIEDIKHSVILLNAVCNFDGRKLENIADIIRDAHENNSIVLIDAAQAIGHDYNFLKKIPYDGLFFSAHKTYAPSLGVMVLRRSIPQLMNLSFLGGGTVEDVQLDSFTLIADPNAKHETFEAGLQDFAGIIGLRAALNWRKTFRPEGQEAHQHQNELAEMIYNGLKSNSKVVMVNAKPSAVISFYAKNIDAHRIAMFLSEHKIMVRSGYFCCHYYLKNHKKLPPLVRVSIGLNNTKSQAQKIVDSINQIINNS